MFARVMGSLVDANTPDEAATIHLMERVACPLIIAGAPIAVMGVLLMLFGALAWLLLRAKLTDT